MHVQNWQQMKCKEPPFTASVGAQPTAPVHEHNQFPRIKKCFTVPSLKELQWNGCTQVLTWKSPYLAGLRMSNPLLWTSAPTCSLHTPSLIPGLDHRNSGWKGLQEVHLVLLKARPAMRSDQKPYSELYPLCSSNPLRTEAAQPLCYNTVLALWCWSLSYSQKCSFFIFWRWKYLSLKSAFL